jgi:PAS domain-containing protein
MRQPEYSDSVAYEPAAINRKQFTTVQIAAALRRLGKIHPVDELNCSGCGYNSCRDFVQAMLSGKAEASMCVSYMRKLALNKANALIKAMPSGVVIVDDQLRVIECNKRFVELIGEDAVSIYEVNPGLEGAYLNRLVPFYKYFQQILESDATAIDKEMRFQDKIVRLLVFPIEPHHIAGGILQDITEPSVHREQIITKAEQLIKQNLTTVQQIAFLLGENAAESEILLNSMIESFSV